MSQSVIKDKPKVACTVSCLYEKYAGPLTSYFISNGLSIDLAEDLVQDVFVKLIRREEQLNEIDHLYSWIWKIADNTQIDFFRKKETRIQHSASSDEILFNQIFQENNADIEKLQCCVANSLEMLDLADKQRANALRLLIQHEWSIEQLREYLGKTSKHHASVYLYQSKKKLEPYLKQCLTLEGML